MAREEGVRLGLFTIAEFDPLRNKGETYGTALAEALSPLSGGTDDQQSGLFVSAFPNVVQCFGIENHQLAIVLFDQSGATPAMQDG